MSKLLVIIPIYDSNENITDCIESVLTQTLKDIEISIIVDAAFSKQISILKTYADKDKRIKIIYKKDDDYNTLINHEIQNTNSEYITILETNCIVFERAYEVLYINAKKYNANLIKSYFNSHSDRLSFANINIYKTLEKTPNEVFNINQYPLLLLNIPSVSAGIYSTKSAKAIIYNGDGIYGSFPFLIELFCSVNSIYIVKEYLFTYNLNLKESINNLIQLPINLIECKRTLEKYGILKNRGTFFYIHVLIVFLDYINKIKISNLRKYFILFKDLISEIDNINNIIDNLYFLPRKEKQYLKRFLKSNNYLLIFNEILNRIKKFIFVSYDEDVYNKIILFNLIKITNKPIKLLIETKLSEMIEDNKRQFDNIYKLVLSNSKISNNFYKYLINDYYDILYKEIHHIWYTEGASNELMELYDFFIKNDYFEKNLHYEYWLIYISCLYEIGNKNLAKDILYKYINRYGTKNIHRFLLVSKLTSELGIENESIAKASYIYDCLEENRRNELFENIIRGKKVAIVGNGPSEIGKGNGEKIDSYDIVIRFNNYKVDGYEKDYGTKTDIWLRGPGGRDVKDYSLNNKYLCTGMDCQYINCQIWIDEQFEIIYRDLMKNKKSFCFFAQNYHKDLIREFRNKYPSTGLSAIYTIYKIKEKFNEKLSIDDIFGFSFLENKEKHYMDHYFNDRTDEESKAIGLVHNLNDESIFLRKLFN